MKPFAPAFEDVDDVRIGWLKDAQDQIRSRKSDALQVRKSLRKIFHHQDESRKPGIEAW